MIVNRMQRMVKYILDIAKSRKIFFVSLTDHGIQNLLKAELEAKTGKEETKVTFGFSNDISHG